MAFTYFEDRKRSLEGTTYETARIIEDWEAENDQGIRRGPASADIVITEFVDFECPFCKRFAPTIDSIVREHPHDVAVVFHHLPLPMHENAIPAAIAAECAERQGQFWEMHDAIFSASVALGEIDWVDVAERADVPNTSVFRRCLEQPVDSFPRIDYGRRLAEREGVRSTPTTWVNGRVIGVTTELIRELVYRLQSP